MTLKLRKLAIVYGLGFTGAVILMGCGGGSSGSVFGPDPNGSGGPGGTAGNLTGGNPGGTSGGATGGNPGGQTGGGTGGTTGGVVGAEPMHSLVQGDKFNLEGNIEVAGMNVWINRSFTVYNDTFEGQSCLRIHQELQDQYGMAENGWSEIYAAKLQDGAFQFLAFQSESGAIIRVASSTGTAFPAKFYAGMTHALSYVQSDGLSTQGKFTALGKETISVKAGTLPAWKTSYSGSSFMLNGQGTNADIWMSADLGWWVKLVQYGDANGYAFTFTEELSEGKSRKPAGPPVELGAAQKAILKEVIKQID